MIEHQDFCSDDEYEAALWWHEQGEREEEMRFAAQYEEAAKEGGGE